MSSEKKRPTDEDLLAQLGALGDDTEIAKKAPPTVQGQQQSEADLLAELGIPERQKPTSRPHTPRLQSSSTTPASKNSPKRAGFATPTSNEGARTSEDKAVPRKSGESTRSFHRPSSFTLKAEAEIEPEPEEKRPDKEEVQSGGGWWGGIFATASAAVKHAEALAKEIQHNEEAQRWAEQVKGNVGALRGFGGELRSRALPTFTNILHTLAPPISSHERLQIHITHDIIGYPSLDPLIYQTFSRVMAQVEGGDLMVIQRGQESSPRQGSDAGFTGSSSSGWGDGPWWRQSAEARSLGAVGGLVEGTKLSRVSAESHANEYFASQGGLEEVAKQATKDLSTSNPVRSSNIFLSIQAITYSSPTEYFGNPSSSPEKAETPGVIDPSDSDNLLTFALYLHDPVHGLTFTTLTQPLPEKWLSWLDNATPTSDFSETNLPEEIAEIINTGGVDPREWVAEWVEETLGLGVGVVAQRYVARRMGVGEGGLGRGKGRQEAVESGGGEAARAV